MQKSISEDISGCNQLFICLDCYLIYSILYRHVACIHWFYLLVSVFIGLYAAKRVKTTADYAVAGLSLPLAVVIATTFATWFGSETVLGVSAKFVQGGLGAVMEDPVGASMCLILVALFFAYKLYQNNLITIGDYSASVMAKVYRFFAF